MSCKSFFFSALLLLSPSIVLANLSDNLPLTLFPIQDYNQDIDAWLSPKDPDYKKLLVSLDYQQARAKELYQHVYGDLSPWSPNYIQSIIKQSPNIAALENQLITQFDNTNKSPDQINYGENFRPYDANWIKTIADSMNVEQFNNLTYQPQNRAIALENLQGRLLPTNDSAFYSYTYAGQGYPFDNLQNSAIWIGTPLYVLGVTKDRSWSLVSAASFIAWVPSSGISSVDDNFVGAYQMYAQKNGIAAIIQTNTQVKNTDDINIANAYVGTFFPIMQNSTDENLMVLVPLKDIDNNQMQATLVMLNNQQAVEVPYIATPQHFAQIISQLQGRQYGWGGMYFYNDCSAELKNLFAAFGIWLPRNSAAQPTMGYMVDKTTSNMDQRLDYLIKNGHELMTIVYIGGHVVLFVENYIDVTAHSTHALIYNNIWGLRPKSGTDSRVVIGESVFLPMLKQYPENPNLQSLADKKYFQVSFLDQWPATKAKFVTPKLSDLIFPEKRMN